MNVLILCMWLQGTECPTPAALRDLLVFLQRKKKDSGDVINVIFSDSFYTMILIALSEAFERGSTMCSTHMKTVHTKLFDITVVYSYLKRLWYFSSSNTSRPDFGNVSYAFVWCNGHTQWPVGLITYVYSLRISEAVCSRNFFFYVVIAWSLTQQESNVCPSSP